MINILAGSMISHDWRIFDVGGCRSLVRLAIFFRTADELRLLTFLSEVRKTSP